ncbi:YbjN domain-containing protein [Isoptericola sp. NPDC057653]|uniref:YbjN domain-containing protein n=1 Tax=unclassified Isoptericola TaxID=2623355 RepID=UPI0036CFCE24
MTGTDRSGGLGRRVLRGARRAADAVGRAVQDVGTRVATRTDTAPVRPGRPAAGPRPLSSARVADDLSRRGYRFRTDDDGDVTGTWDGNRFWFLLLGDHEEILQVRGRWAGTVPEGSRMAVLQAANDWNRERVWPKVYTRPEGDGLALYTEVSADFEHGATDEQLAATVSCGLVTSSQFFSTVGALAPGPEPDDLD